MIRSLYNLQCAVALRLLLIAALIGCFGVVGVFGQILDRRPTGQQLPQRDTATTIEVSDLPDTIRLFRYDPRSPLRFSLIPDSALGLDYVRYDPIKAAGPDYISLNSLAQPAMLNPALGATYQRYRPLTQLPHPAYRDRPPPFLAQNVPFSYTAYDQGTEVDDGQVRAIFGRSFTGGWRLGADYHRIYQGGQRTRYPQSRAQRISFGITLARVADSSRHRSYAYIDLNNRSWTNSGGYSFALDDSTQFPDQAFAAVPLLTDEVRTEGKNSTYSYMHRYFLRVQPDSIARGWAGRASAEVRRGTFRTSVVSPDSSVFGPYAIDDRGIRLAMTDRSVLAEAALEYFADQRQTGGFALNFSAGAYAGQQRYGAEFLEEDRGSTLLGLTGSIDGRLPGGFTLRSNADLPLATRAGEGRLSGNLSWTWRQRFEVGLDALLERTAAPWLSGVIGVNQRVVLRTDLPVSTHTRLGGSVRYVPWGISVRGHLDFYANAITYADFGAPSAAAGDIAIPTLSYDVPARLGPLHLQSRGTLRAQTGSAAVRYPSYVGQHSAYIALWPFARAMNVVTGFDAIMRSPFRRYGFFPLTSAFTLESTARESPWTYNLDFFIAFKVQSFKAFVRVDQLLVSDSEVGPSTVEGYPVVRGGAWFGNVRPLVRMGVAFFLFN